MKLSFPPAWLAARVLRARYAAVLRDQRDPLAAQRRAYRRLRAALRGTEIARTTGLSAAADLDAFARDVPPRGYEDIAGLVARVVDGERSVLFHDAPRFIGLSSGTTGSNNKRIVHNAASIQGFRDFEFALAAIAEHHTGVNPAVCDRLCWGAAPTTNQRVRGVEQGYISGYLATRTRWLLRRRTVPSAAVGLIPDMGRKIRETGREARGRDIRMASAVPSYLIHLLEELRAAWGVADFSQIWPRLDVVFYSGTPIECYREPIVRLLGHPVHFAGMYLATECAIGYEIPALNGGRHGLFSLHLSDTVYTFRKLEGDGRVLTLGDLAAGDVVELFLSAQNGLINYRLGDCLKIHSVAPLLFEVTGRIGQGLNMAAEKVTISQLTRAAARVGETLLTPLRHFFICPGTSPAGRPCYEWTLLLDQPAAAGDLAALSAALDRAVMTENDDYREAREDLGFLDAPRVHVLDAAVARRYFARDAARGQLKMKNAFESPALLQAFLRELEPSGQGG